MKEIIIINICDICGKLRDDNHFTIEGMEYHDIMLIKTIKFNLLMNKIKSAKPHE